VNISDTDFTDACVRFQAGIYDTVPFYHSDSCSDDLLAIVGPYSDCDLMSRYVSSSVWGVETGGQCLNISDLSFPDACREWRDY